VQNRKYIIYFGSQKTRTEIHNGSFGSVSSVPVLGYFGSVPRFRFFLPRPNHRRDRRAHLDEKVRRGYHPRCGGRYDSGEDRSPSPEPPGPQAFSRAIRRAPFPTRFRTPTTITKYSGETRPELWLADYRLACQLGGTDDDNLIIRNLPMFLSDAARAWLEHLPPAQISNWDDLVKAFTGNF
jgi:hypothetical protein